MRYNQPLKKIILIVFMQGLLTSCLAQDKPDKDTRKSYAYFASPPVKTLVLPIKKQSKGTIPFKNISIIDTRYDTVTIGFERSQLLNNFNRLLFSPYTTSDEIKRYIAGNYTLDTTSDSAFNLVIVVEKYWLTSSLMKDSAHYGIYKKAVFVKAGLLAERGGVYQPIYQVNSLFDDVALGTDDNETMLAAAIDEMLDNVTNKQISSLKLSKHKYTLDNLKDYARERLNIPILTTNTYVKGMYKTFEEFKNNAPSIPRYEVGYKGKIDMVRGFDKDSTPVSQREAWGFCDGKQLYIFSSDNFFPLIKNAGTFNVLGFKSFTYKNQTGVLLAVDARTLSPLLFVPVPTAGTYKDIKMPLQLDMETGLLN